MRVFVAGGTGVLGTRVVVRLVAAGHEVRALARSEAKAAELRAIGAEPVVVDLFDRDALIAAVSGSDAVCNLATRIPPLNQAARKHAWDENDRIRVEGSANLVDAALASHARRYVQESLAFAYRDGGDAWLDEDSPRYTELVGAPVAAAEANAQRFGEHGGTWVVLRFGKFYGAGATHTDDTVAAAKRGMAVDLGDPTGYFPAIHLDDAASAVVAALDAPSGAYNVVDDEQLTRREQDAALARVVGRRRLHRPPRPMERAAGSSSVLLTSSQRVSNRRFRDATGWSPRYPSVREGWAEVVGPVEPSLRISVRVCTWLLALNGLLLGSYALFFPSAFYADFPFGRGWVAMDGPYNQHLVRDFGAMNLALAAVALAAIAFASVAAARAAAIGWLVFAVPHYGYHLRHLEHMPTIDAWMTVLSLAWTVALPIALLWFARSRPAPRDAGTGSRSALATAAGRTG